MLGSFGNCNTSNQFASSISPACGRISPLDPLADERDHQRMRERPRLAGEVAAAADAHADFLRDFAREALLERLAGLDEAGERAVHARPESAGCAPAGAVFPSARAPSRRAPRAGRRRACTPDRRARARRASPRWACRSGRRTGGRGPSRRSCSARPASAKWSSSSTENSGRRPSQDNPAGGAAFAGSSAAQQSTPPSRPRYSVRLASGPHQLWFFRNGKRANAGRARNARVVARTLRRPELDQQLVAAEHEPVALGGCSRRSKAASNCAGERNGSSIMR